MPNCIFCDQENPADATDCRLCHGPLPSAGGQLGDEVFREHLIRLLGEGQRIQAVAAWRRQYSVDLDTAVAAVNTLEQDREFDVRPGNADLEWNIIGYLERGEKIAAIRYYREQSGVGLKEAKDFVEAIELRMNLGPTVPTRGGCLGIVMFCLIGATCLLAR